MGSGGGRGRGRLGAGGGWERGGGSRTGQTTYASSQLPHRRRARLAQDVQVSRVIAVGCIWFELEVESRREDWDNEGTADGRSRRSAPPRAISATAEGRSRRTSRGEALAPRPALGTWHLA